MAEKQQKNRRSRNAKLSEYRLRKIVTCFARNMTAKEAVEVTKFSEPTVRKHFMELRQHLFDYGLMRVQRSADDAMQIPARAIFARKHRGVPERFALLYESEVLHRIYFTKNGRAVRRFSASDPEQMKELRKFINYNKMNEKYDIIEILEEGRGAEKPMKSRPFEPDDYKPTSIIVVNELNIQPHDVFFRYIWAMLLKHPL